MLLQVCRDDTCQDDAVIAELEHPVRGSEAWQWVEGTVSDNGTSEVVIRLALKNYEVTTQKRQVDNGSAFFDDISVMVTSKLNTTWIGEHVWGVGPVSSLVPRLLQGRKRSPQRPGYEASP